MEFEKHEKGSLLDKNLQARLTVSSGDSEAKPLMFSFVPTIGRLPAHIQLADTSKYLVRIPEEPGDKSPETVNRSKSTDVTFNSGNNQETVQGTLTGLSQVCEKNSQGGIFKANDLQGMQQGDLFKAEYVFIVDSEGEEEVTSRKADQETPGRTGNTLARPKSLAISSSLVPDVVRPKVWGPEPKTMSRTEAPQEMASQQRHGQRAPPVPVGADPAGGPAQEQLGARRAEAPAPSPAPRARSPRSPRGSPAAAAYLPVRIVTHSLCPSPAALPAPATSPSASSSSAGSRRPSGARPAGPGPSRLALLTAVLKSRPRHQGPSSPASCPALSLASLASSTPTLERSAPHSRAPTPAAPACPEEDRFSPSPALANLLGRSREAAARVPAPGPLAPPRRDVPAPAPVPTPAPAPAPARPPGPAAQLSEGLAAWPARARAGRSESTKSTWGAPFVSLTRTQDLIAPSALSEAAGPENKKPKQYKTKSSYKVFAAIPTNTLLLEQKALDAPAQAENVSQDSSRDLPLELCFPAQLRQQTEELCATIDKVLQDSLSMHSSDSSSRSPKQTLLGSETIKTPPTLPRAAGRETKYANLSSVSSAASEGQLTKPGVIRPVPIKSKILLKKEEEEVYEPNPFSKYLDDNSGLFSEQDVTAPPKPVSLHPLYQTKLYPPAKSLLRPQTISHTDCLSPGPFGHLSSSSLHDEQSSHALFSHIACDKLGHPLVAIPEHETLDSKEQ